MSLFKIHAISLFVIYIYIFVYTQALKLCILPLSLQPEKHHPASAPHTTCHLSTSQDLHHGLEGISRGGQVGTNMFLHLLQLMPWRHILSENIGNSWKLNKYRRLQYEVEFEEYDKKLGRDRNLEKRSPDDFRTHVLLMCSSDDMHGFFIIPNDTSPTKYSIFVDPSL